MLSEAWTLLSRARLPNAIPAEAQACRSPLRISLAVQTLVWRARGFGWRNLLLER